MTTPLMVRIDGKRDDLIQLTQDLIRIPTLNPPGENYGAICDFLNKRLQASGFETQLIRAFDTPGDSERYPVGTSLRGAMVHLWEIAFTLTATPMWLRSGPAGRLIPLAAKSRMATSTDAVPVI